MVLVTRFIGAAALFAAAIAVPVPDSSIGEVAVSAPNGTPLSDSATQTSASGTSPASGAQMTQAPQYGGSYGSNAYASSAPAYQSSSASSSSYSASSYSAPAYGSGKDNWGGSGYDSCVQQCVASYSAPPYQYMPTAASSSAGSQGTGATHTVIVAPTQGVLRYVPFALNASVGDTVRFMWGANNHTVTKSSALTPCNKSGDAPFASGTQNKSFEFSQVVNSTEPVWFYCGTPGHCQKGMFGVINPASSWGSSNSVGMMAGQIAKNDSDMAALWSNMNQMTQGNDKAANWGNSIDLSGMPQWAQMSMMENVMYTRNFLSMNKDVLKDDGSVDLGTSNPLSFPNDMSTALNGAASSSSAASSTPASSTAVTSSAASSPSVAAASNSKKNGASSLTSSKALVGLMAIAATLFAL